MHLAYRSEATYGSVLGGGVVVVRAGIAPAAAGAAAAMPVTAQRMTIAGSALDGAKSHIRTTPCRTIRFPGSDAGRPEPDRAIWCSTYVGSRPAGVVLVIALLGVLVVSTAGVGAARGESSSGTTIHVPQDVPTLRLAIERARPGDTVVLAPGVYPGGTVVPPAKHDITIAGADRNRVVLDGANVRRNGIVVHADGVSILNMSARNFLEKPSTGRARTVSARRT